ncbi:acyclic terpene utilization AtuA family protein [Nocardia sp. NPDC058518]|uniref:acyclic terpene utilization AtuA family protein n=1 Tax=Nocardia sp. NPDC058518 TaxID=3346534 RepID=UPI00366191B6
MTTDQHRAQLRIGAFSGFYGDCPDNMKTLLDNGVDVLMGDYLAELTMLILRKAELRGGPGYARTFVAQLEGNLQQIKDQGVKVVANAGGLAPEECAAAIRAVCREAGVDLTVAAVVGDNLRETLDSDLGGAVLANMDTGEKLDLAQHEILTANAYLGAWPIVEALDAGADIVVCPRMTDASLVVGPAAWYFGWDREDWDKLASAVVVGHIIECGGQATGGMYGHFYEHEDLGHPGLPLADIAADGTSIISKSAPSGGVVTVDTIKAQLFYEVGSPKYHNPDVITDLATVRLADLGEDRVQVSGVRGSRPTTTTKLSLTYEGGYRNMMTIGVTGAHIPEKIAWLKRQIEGRVGTPETFDGFRWSVIGPNKPIDGTYDEATALVILHVRDRDATKVGRTGFSDRIVQMCLASIPGHFMTTTPQNGRLFGVQWPCLIDKSLVSPVVRIDGRPDIRVPWLIGEDTEPVAPEPGGVTDLSRFGPTTPAVLGDIAITRSGDKGGKANVGIWVRTAEAYEWLTTYLTVERFVELVPEAAGLPIDRYRFDNLLGLNFVVTGFLEDGVSSCTRIDAQGKAIGEYLASHTVPIPREILQPA